MYECMEMSSSHKERQDSHVSLCNGQRAISTDIHLHLVPRAPHFQVNVHIHTVTLATTISQRMILRSEQRTRVSTT